MSDESKGRMMQGFVGGLLVAGTVAVGLYLSRQPDQPPAPAAPTAPMAAPSFAQPQPQQPPEPASPREVADSLFNEAMMAAEKNDQATLGQVLPGAIAAYRALPQLDDDGTYHLALLELAANNLPAARATCDALLAKNPNHLLALGVAVKVALKGNDAAAAKELGQRFLKAYDTESVRQLPEYRDHERMLPAYRTEAMAVAK